MVVLEVMLDSSRARREARRLEQSLQKVERRALTAERAVRNVGRARVGRGVGAAGFAGGAAGRGRGGGGGRFAAGAALGRTLPGGLGAFAGVGLAGAAILGPGLFLAEAVRNGAAFEAQMAEIRAITQATNVEMEQLQELTFQLARNTEFSARELAGGVLQAVRAGARGEELTTLLRIGRDVATVTNQTVEAAVEQVNTLRNAFRLSFGELPERINQIVRASNITRQSLAQMIAPIGKAGAAAQSLGVALEDVLALQVLATRAGASSSQLQTALSSFTTTLARRRAEGREIFERFPEFAQAVDEGRLVDAFVELEKAGGSYVDLLQIMEGEQLRWLGITVTSAEEMAKLREEILNGTANLQEMAEIMRNTVANQWRQLTSELEDNGVRLFQDLEEPIKDLIKALREVFSILRDGSAVMGVISTVIQAVLANLTFLISAFSRVMEFFDRQIESLARSLADIVQIMLDLEPILRRVIPGFTLASELIQFDVLSDRLRKFAEDAEIARQAREDFAAALGTTGGGLTDIPGLGNVNLEQNLRRFRERRAFERSLLFQSDLYKDIRRQQDELFFRPENTAGQEIAAAMREDELLRRIENVQRGGVDAVAEIAGAFAIMGDEGVEAIERIARALQELALEELALAPLRSLLQSISGEALAGIFNSSGGSTRGSAAANRTLTRPDPSFQTP